MIKSQWKQLDLFKGTSKAEANVVTERLQLQHNNPFWFTAPVPSWVSLLLIQQDRCTNGKRRHWMVGVDRLSVIRLEAQ